MATERLATEFGGIGETNGRVPAFDSRAFEVETQAIGRRLYAAAGSHKPRLYQGVSGWLLRGTMEDASLRTALFEFVDALPQLASQRDIAEHLAAYLTSTQAGGWRKFLLRLAANPGLAWLARAAVRRLADQFLVAETPGALDLAATRLACVPALLAVDAVGEAVLSEAEAARYLDRNRAILGWLAQRGQTPHLSLKLTGLTGVFDPLDRRGTRQRVFQRVAPLIVEACRCHAMLTVDMEHYELKPLILDLFLEMLEAWPDPAWQPGIALQAYLPETERDVERLLAAAQRYGRRIGVRLVKGAYWDQEAAWAAQRGWPRPTLTEKAATDAHFERLAGSLLAHADTLHPAIASHNLRSQAVALAQARRLGLPPDRWEAQMLLGMAEPLRDALAAAGAPLRIYVPIGDPVIGMAYLIRRLLENTASTSILRQSYIAGAGLDTLLAAPSLARGQAAPAAVKAPANLPLIDFSRPEEQASFAAALQDIRAALPQRVPLPGAVGIPSVHAIRNPAQPAEILGEAALADTAYADGLVDRAVAAFPQWRSQPVPQRVQLLRRASDQLALRRREFAALEVLSVAKNWREADADVAEAVDFLRYYANEMERCAGWRETVGFPGEQNRMRYEPRGLALIVAPWNFPLAILAGMTAAALAAGNCAIMKPALPGLLLAEEFHRLLLAAGFPGEVCQLLPADADVAAHLVAHPCVQVIAFTGSHQVGLSILQAAHTATAAQTHVKQVICEMGGKNAIIVDRDADLDEAVAGILASAFGYAGQKCSACSRVIAVDEVHDRLLARLADAAAALSWGAPEDGTCAHGPLISEAARDKALAYIEIGRAEGRLVWQGKVPETGWYVPPTLFAGIKPEHRLAREEIFGPVLAAMRAENFAAALALAQDCDYALTGGVYSRFPPHLALAQNSFSVGNLYLNRKITGARVGVQPFGGFNLSGTGVQAGGPDYLKQFMWSRVVSANTIRHGFIP
ncbi:MAG: proline dehydrogenase family protein [Sterolibacterium sp.]